jgi:Mn-dependent DtxR family transcriptional regulator
MKILESGENYLEAILQLGAKNGNVRSIDIANYFDYSKPSISRAMAVLKKAGYITMDDSGLICLTPSGREIADKIYERHQVLEEYLMLLGISKESAVQDACRIEHVICEETFEKIKEHAYKYRKEAF